MPDYNHITLSAPLQTQTVVTCLITSAKSKSIWQTSLLKLNNHFGKVQVKWINYRANQYRIFPRHQIFRDGGKLSCSRSLDDEEFQLAEPWSAKILVEEAQKCKYTVSQKLRKKCPEKSVQKTIEHLYRSLQICSCPYVAVARSLQILKEKRLTDLYRFSRKAQNGVSHWSNLKDFFVSKR